MATIFTEPTTITYTTEQCIGCGTRFAMDSTLVNQRRRDHLRFYCPNGHSQYYPGESDVEKARRERDEARQATAEARADLAAERTAHSATKDQLTRTKKRATAGICIECKRTFANVARHMQTKHPAPTTHNP